MLLNFTKPIKRTYQKGKWAEVYACLLLLLKGYTILARRWQTPVGEIDIIARRKNILIAVEVKYRAEKIQAIQAITKTQQQRIARALQLWLKSKERRESNLRFDVVIVSKRGWAHHIKNAWHF